MHGLGLKGRTRTNGVVRSAISNLLFLFCFLLFPPALMAVTLTVQTNRIGVTPSLLAYNSGHFVPGSNTRDWWRYSAVTGARVFLSPGIIEPGDDIAGRAAA